MYRDVFHTHCDTQWLSGALSAFLVRVINENIRGCRCRGNFRVLAKSIHAPSSLMTGKYSQISRVHHLMQAKSFLPGLIMTFCASASLCSFAAEQRASSHSNNASTILMETASQQYADGQLDQAAASLERALQIQPNNPATLHYLGVLRLQQGQYQQAEALAARSNLRVGSNIALRNRNIQLMQAAQKAQASNTPPNAENDLVAVLGGLQARLSGVWGRLVGN